ncbi:hypothetical protein M408DRAFT_30895 [Serendipita vermifera MAFF 305830]|uniref:Extracellular membrane protein CFEM domain-containing protein n=1 Tax=Serendipita vermifera MAFF 305830 TaxID=933852 RepID=A0A0C3A564_SERVB|nr:hypothetical protein M408DRAFT_30895 [Serendipita vermifera MAFF 305830]
MVFKHLFILAACSWSVLGFALIPRAPNFFLTGNLGDLPTACQPGCIPVINQINSISEETFFTLCNGTVSANFIECVSCVQTNEPETFTPEVFRSIEISAGIIESGCSQVGSPIPSISIPGATGTVSATGSASGAFSELPTITASTPSATLSATPSPSSSQPGSPSATTSKPNAAGRKFEAISLVTVGFIMLSMSILA